MGKRTPPGLVESTLVDSCVASHNSLLHTVISPAERWSLAPLLGAILVLGVVLGRPTHAQSITVDTPDRTVNPEDTATVPVRVKNLNQVGDVVSYGFDIGFDTTAVSYVGFTTTNTLSGMASFTVDENPAIPRVGAFLSSDPLNVVADEGVLLRLTFAVEDTGTHSVSLEDLQFSGGEVPADPPTPAFTLTGNSLAINEVLTAPPSGAGGDANDDGTRDAQEDEFIELYNTSSTEAMELGGLALRTASGGRQHVFPEGTSVGPESGIVVFGGGDPASSLPSPTQTASSGGLGLADDGDTVRLVNTAGVAKASRTEASINDAAGEGVLRFEYDGSITDESMTRDPEFTGDFVPHTQVSNDPFSPARTTSGDALPVELVRFDGTVMGQRVRLRWATASETNSAGFRVQHQSSDGWQTLGFVESRAANGTTTRTTTYRFVAQDVTVGTHRFRLEQVDRDGATHRSELLAITVGMKDPLHLSTPRPNPASAQTRIAFAIRRQAEARLTVYDLLGRRVKTLYQGRLSAEERQEVSLQTDAMPSGTYLLRLRARGQSATRRLTVLR